MSEHATIAAPESRITAALGETTQVISGVAVGAGDVTRGLSGDRKVWTEEELRDAAESLIGGRLKALHSEAAVGEVRDAGYVDDTGVVYEAEVSDAELANAIENGRLTVSVEARHADGGRVETPRGEAMKASDIQFTDLAIVQHGAAPSATATAGEAAALAPAEIPAALEHETLVEVNGTKVDLSPPERVVNAVEAGFEAKAEYEELADCGTGVGEAIGEAIVNDELTPEIILNGGDIADNGGPTTYLASHAEDAPDTPPTEWDEQTWTDGCGPVQDALWGHYLGWFEGVEAELEAAMEDANTSMSTQTALAEAKFSEGDLVRWSTSAAPGTGRVAAVVTESGESVSANGADVTREATDEEAAYKLDNWDGDAYESGTVVKSASELIGAWDDAPETARMAGEMDVPEEYAFSNPGEAVTKAKEMGVGEGRELAGDELIHTHGDGEDTVFMPAPTHEELVEMLDGESMAAGTPDDPQGEVPGPTAARLGGHLGAAMMGEMERAMSDRDAKRSELLEEMADEAEMSVSQLRRVGRGETTCPSVDAIEAMASVLDTDMSMLLQAAERDGCEYSSAAGRGGHGTKTRESMSENTQELKADLAEKANRIEELEAEVERLRAEREPVAMEYAEALASAGSLLSAGQLTEKFSVEELSEMYADATAELAAEEPEATVRSGSSGEASETAGLSADKRDRVEELEAELSDWEGRDSRLASVRVEEIEEELAELRGEA